MTEIVNSKDLKLARKLYISIGKSIEALQLAKSDLAETLRFYELMSDQKKE